MNTIEKATKGLIGKLCWGVEWESQLNMSMSFGDPILRIREPAVSESRSHRVRAVASRRIVVVKGKWWLWIFWGYWKLEIPNVVTAKSSSPLCAKKCAMACLSGQRMMDIRVDANDGSTGFAFDLGAILQARPFERGDDADVWTLYKPNGYVVGVRGDGTFTHARGTTPGDELVPMRLKTPKDGAANGGLRAV